jgi:hypothetical protein
VALDPVSRRELGSDEADIRTAGKFCANCPPWIVVLGLELASVARSDEV